MMRDARGNETYWNEWVDFGEEEITERMASIGQPTANADYLPQYIYGLSNKCYEQMIRRYSRGDAVESLNSYFEGVILAWEESERLGKDVWSPQVQNLRHAWKLNLDHYIRCFWLTGLAFTLKISDEQWRRLLALVGNEGKDALLDLVIASRQSERKIGRTLCFPRPYQGLLDVVQAPEAQRSKLLRDYLDVWFQSLNNSGHSSFPNDHRSPYWWNFCDDVELGMKGGYFGCWCIEAVAVARAFKIDDTLCLDHPNYPGDLIQDGRAPRYPDSSPTTRESWLGRLLSRKD